MLKPVLYYVFTTTDASDGAGAGGMCVGALVCIKPMASYVVEIPQTTRGVFEVEFGSA